MAEYSCLRARTHFKTACTKKNLDTIQPRIGSQLSVYYSRALFTITARRTRLMARLRTLRGEKVSLSRQCTARHGLRLVANRKNYFNIYETRNWGEKAPCEFFIFRCAGAESWNDNERLSWTGRDCRARRGKVFHGKENSSSWQL